MAKQLFLFCLLLTHISLAQTDLKLSGYFRNYPIAGGVDAEYGYNYVLWGAPAKGEPLYSYVRAFANASTSYSYNSAAIGAEFYPISILGLRYGYERTNNSQNYRDYDCETNRCHGNYSHTYLDTKIVLGYWGFFLIYENRAATWKNEDTSGVSFIEPNNALILSDSNDSITRSRMFLGYTFSDFQLSLMWIQIDHEADTSGAKAKFDLIGAKKKLNDTYSVLGALGRFESSIHQDHSIFLMAIEYTIFPDIAVY